MKHTNKVVLLWRLARGRRRWYALASAALLIGTAFSFLPPLVIRFTLDGLLAEQLPEDGGWLRWFAEALGGHEHLADHLWAAAAVIVAFTAVSGLFMYLKSRWAATASEDITRDLRDNLFGRLARVDSRYHDKSETGDLVQRCTSDVDTIRMFLSSQIVELARASSNLLIVVPIMLMLDWRMTVASTVLLPILCGFAVVFFAAIRRNFKAADEAEAALTSVLQENLTGIRVVRAFARQEYEQDKFDQRNEDHRGKSMKMYWLFAWYWSASDLLSLLQMAMALFFGAYLVSLGEAGGGISVGTLVAFWTYVGMVIWPVRQMGRVLAELGKAVVSMERVDEVLNAPLESEPGEPIADRPARVAGQIAFDRVSFSYGDGQPVLRDVSFTLEPGQTLGILGPSGSGKSTIVNLLMRFYDPQSGAIRLDGMDLSQLPRPYVRSQVGVAMQEPFLFSKTVRENITLGRRDAAEAEMFAVADVARVHDNIEQFEHKYDTPVGERGVTLSGGQRQRVSLARALLQKPPILVLDDTLSAVDTHTETLILDALRSRRGEQTTIVIAHRVSTLMHADCVLVLESGRIVEHGPHHELIQSDGLYRRLWQIQGALEDDLEQELESRRP